MLETDDPVNHEAEDDDVLGDIVGDVEGDIDLINEPITKDEVTRALISLKNGKAPGSDGFIGEMFKAAVENEVHFTLCCSALKDLRQRLIPEKFYSQPSSFRLVLLLSTENMVIIKNFAIFLYLAFKRRELLLRE